MPPLNFSKRYYKPGTKRYIEFKSIYTNLDPEVVEKAGYCMEHDEAFGLDSPDGCYIFSTADGIVAHFDKARNKTVNQFPNKVALESFVSTCLYTHTDFISPLNCYKFLLSVKHLKESADANNNRRHIIMPDDGRDS